MDASYILVQVNNAGVSPGPVNGEALFKKVSLTFTLDKNIMLVVMYILTHLHNILCVCVCV